MSTTAEVTALVETIVGYNEFSAAEEDDWMTEERWDTENSLPNMLYFLGYERQVQRTKMGRRLLRLFGCASCPHIWHLVPDGDCRRAVGVAEAYADDVCANLKLNAARNQVAVALSIGDVVALLAVASVVNAEARMASRAGSDVSNSLDGRWGVGNVHFCTLLRDLFDNPFRPITFDRRWRTETTVAFASGIYSDRAFDRMPILADALEEAGCDVPEVLAHCRGPGPHARGCWVVDGVLDKR